MNFTHVSARIALFAVVAASAAGCRGKAVATAQLRAPGSADVTFPSTGKPLVLWADTDGEWHGGSNSHFAAHYEIDVLANGANIGHLVCDTKDTSESVCGATVSTNNSHRGDCELKLACQLPTIPSGPATLHVTGTLGAGTSNVKNMSVNVREK